MNKAKVNIGEQLSRIGLAITAISLLTFAVGCYIINTNLANYQILDFDLVKPRAVLVGFTFIFLLSVNVAAYFIVPPQMMTEGLVDVKGLKRHNTLKFLFLTVILFLVFEYDLATHDFCRYTFFEKEYDYMGLVWFLFCFLLLCNIGVDEIKYLWLRKAVYYITVVAGIFLFLLYARLPNFILIMLAQGVIALAVTDFHAKIGEGLNTQIKEIEIEDGNEEIEQPEHPSDTKVRELLKRFKKYYSNYYNVAYGVLSVLGVSIVAYIYSDNLYDRIPQSIGGGKLYPIAYVTEKDTVKGKKIYETENYVFVFLKDSTIKKLDWGDITKILKQPSR